jgi:hypothetical protein
MEVLMLLVLVVVGWLIIKSLGIVTAMKEVVGVATRESTVYNREHKVSVAKRYMNMTTDVDAEKVNAAIATVDAYDFD